MLRALCISAVAFHASLALADKTGSVRDLTSRPAVVIHSDADAYDGCGLNELASAQGTQPAESMLGYSDKALGAASKGAHVEAVWGWCVKPDLAVRLWAACAGAGDSATCTLYAAPIGANGKLGKIVHTALGWSPPTLEDVDSANTPAAWGGRGLKVAMAAGRGDAWFGVYLAKGKIKFTKPEWDE